MLIINPYRKDKDLGRAYNEAMELVPDGGHACFMDIDAMFLTPQQPGIIESYIEKNPDAVLTCYTNRISPLSRQLMHGRVSENFDIKMHAESASIIATRPMTLKKINNMISGFLMVIPKSVWSKIKFKEGIGCLGVDTQFSNECHKNGVEILLMENIYVFHLYRPKGIYDKKHLV